MRQHTGICVVTVSDTASFAVDGQCSLSIQHVRLCGLYSSELTISSSLTHFHSQTYHTRHRLIMVKARFYRHIYSSLLLSFLIVVTSSAHAFSPTTTSTTLITFDVDGTLVQGSGNAPRDGAHAQAFAFAIGHVLAGKKDGRDGVANVADVLPKHLYHGSTDGLILIRYAQAALNVPPEQSAPQLDTLMQVMYEYIMTLDDEAVANCLSPLPGVMETLERLTDLQRRQSQQDSHTTDLPHVLCGLVTGNVEGIARRKMKAVGILQTGVFHPPCSTQKEWIGTEDMAFLGGFGSDYCSKDIDNINRNYLDRAEQIKIAATRCHNILEDEYSQSGGKTRRILKRVVHVGDAPSDVLAAKVVADSQPGYCVGMVAVATGSYSAEELTLLCGTPSPRGWDEGLPSIFQGMWD